jgi:pimeloyl-ACP methyl ester carboxylesterase
MLDLVAPPAANEANLARIPNARYVPVPDCAHILPWEKPEALVEAARPFLLEAARAVGSVAG